MTVEIIVGFLVSVVTGIITYFTTKSSNKTNRDNKIIESEVLMREQTLGLAMKLQENIFKQLEDLKKENQELKKEITGLKNKLKL